MKLDDKTRNKMNFDGCFCEKISLSRPNDKEFNLKLIKHQFGNEYYDRVIFDELKGKLRSRCGTAFKRLMINKPYKTEKILGADFYEVKFYLESKFTDGMNWDNMGKYGLHIDHIKPLALAKNEKELIELCHYTNLQPLWAKDNLTKNSSYNGVRITFKNKHLYE